MKIKERAVIEFENIHKIEPFFIRYLTIISTLVLIILFIFFFGTKRLNEEYNTVNVWNKKTSSIASPSHDDKFNIDGVFKHNFFVKPEGIVHYFDFNGDTIYSTNLSRGELATLNNKNFVIYKRYGNYIDAYNNTGVIVWRTNTSIYPEISPYAERIIYHSSDNSKIQMFDFNNNPLSRHIQYGEIITDGAFALHTGDYIAGFSSGDIAYINRNGNLSFAISTILSEINIVKSVAISEYGSFALAVSGIRPEYITLYDANGNTIWYLNTELNRRRHVSSYISEKSMTAFMLADKDIILYSMNKGKEINRINIEKYNMQNAINMKLNSETNSTIMSISKDAKSVVLIYDNNDKEVVFEKEIDGWVYNLDISNLENEYMIVTDKMIYTYKRVKL
ncbi:hypothetical protein [uncultured Brachyspira sp.]|uniref:hypothetical protein n=2 Tax=uncultured Brachyspira sp. TaxID=221953 RepID=UPI0025F116EF|nr:hypothetical protein [uncultured Brachyspira sp.]